MSEEKTPLKKTYWVKTLRGELDHEPYGRLLLFRSRKLVRENIKAHGIYNRKVVPKKIKIMFV